MMYHPSFIKSCRRWLALLPIAPVGFLAVWFMGNLTTSSPLQTIPAIAQAPQAGQPLTLRSDIQEANSKTGVITARGNVQIYYPARQIQATSAQAQYFSRERRIVLTGDVYVLQQGNSLRGETITYLIDEGRFVALPQAPKQVEAVYLLQESSSPSPTPAATPAIPTPVVEPFGQPEFSPGSTPAPGSP
ncbi:MAG: LptA/OstA family protein [Leptolyngbyaceae cyanobacterium bins.349]|nr:LptA/OstA family protein [Leptolyngbyaceae cyanobacterium bins.349]